MTEALGGLLLGGILVILAGVAVHSWIDFGKENDLVDTEYDDWKDEDEEDEDEE